MTAVDDPALSAVDDEPGPSPEDQFRLGLIAALERAGFKALCRDEKARDPMVAGGLRVAAVQVFTARAVRIALWMSPGFAIVRLLDAGFLAYAAVAIVAAGLGTWLVPSDVIQFRTRSELGLFRALNSAWAVLAVLALYPVTAVAALVAGDAEDLFVISVFPLLIVVTAGALYASLREVARILRGRVPRLERGAALVFPIGVVALFVQLFTTEVWEAADDMHVAQVLWLAGLTVIPLLLFLFLRLRSSVPEAFTTVAKGLEADTTAESRDALYDDLWNVIGKHIERTDTANKLVSDALHGPTIAGRARAILPEVKRSFDIPLALGLVPMVMGIWSLMALYVYGLAWATVDVRVAGQWLEAGGSAVDTIAPLGFAMPWGPYPVIAAFLGVVATAVFLALALTEDAYKDLLTESAIRIPVRRCLLIGIPYRYLQVKHDRRTAAYPLPRDAEKHTDDNTLATADEDDDERLNSGTGHSLWYRWKAPDRGDWFSFAAYSNEFEPLVAVYESKGATAIAESVDGLPAHFEALRNTEYHVAVDGRRGGRGRGFGAFMLTWSVAPGPANQTLTAADTITELKGVAEGDTALARTDPAERVAADLRGEAALWYRWAAPAARTMLFTAVGNNVATRIVVLSYKPSGMLSPVGAASASDSSPAQVQLRVRKGQQLLIGVETVDGGRGPFLLTWNVAPTPPRNDHFAAATAIGGIKDRIEGSTTHASRELGEPLHAERSGGRSVWYRWTAPDDVWVEFSTEDSDFDTLLAVYKGPGLDQLEVVAANDDALGRVQSLVRFEARRGEEYHVAVDGYAGASGNVVLTWAPLPPPPSNAAFAKPVGIADIAGEVTADTTLAFHEPGEPRHADRPGGKSVWYRWTAPEDIWMEFSTEGSEYDTLLAVYIGDELDDLSVVAANDDARGMVTSVVRFRAIREQEYCIAVDGHAGAGGKMRLAWEPGAPPPLNDDFANARDLNDVPSPCVFNTLHATNEPGEPRHADRTGGASVWFRWRADRTGWVRFSTEGSGFDTLLAAYLGESVNALRPVAANDDASAKDTTSRIGFRAVAGVEYRIAVDGYYGSSGDVVLSWERVPRHRVLSFWWANRRYR